MIDNGLAPWGITTLRMSLGSMWIAHALLKVFVFTLPGTAAFFAGAGFPGWSAYPVVAAELIGGAMIFLGIYARQISLLLVPILLGAIAVHAGNGWVFSAAGGGWEYPAFLAVSSLVLVLLGDGKWTLRMAPLPGMPR